MLATLKKYIRKPWVIVVGIVILIIIFLIVRNAGKKPIVETYTAKKTTVKEEVSVTGKVTPFQKSDLGFEKGGTIATVNVAVGDKVTRGQTIASLSDQQTYAALIGARANLAAAQAALADSQTNTQIDYTNAQKNALDAFRQARTKVEDVMLSSVDGFFRGGSTINPVLLLPTETYAIERNVELKRYDVTLALNSWKSDTNTNPTADDAQRFLDNAQNYLAKVDTLMSALSSVITTYTQSNFGLSQATIDGYFSTLNTASSNLSTARATITNAENNLDTSKPKSTKSLQARVEQARADVANYEAQYAKSLVLAPFDGIITRIDPQPGDIVGGGQIEFSIIGGQAFKVEANIAEADVAKVQEGQKASITLDAYGADVVFDASVIRIDPAETVVDGVPTYITTFQFTADDPRIKSGMTANIDITGNTHENVIAVPQRAVANKNGGKYVVVKNGDVTHDVEIKTGLRGADGLVEVVSGLSEGDMVVISSTP